MDESSYWTLSDKYSEWTGSYSFVLYKYVSFDALVFLLMTIAAYVVETSRLLYLFSLSNKWNYPHLNVYEYLLLKREALEVNARITVE